MSENYFVPRGVPPRVLGFNMGAAIQAADVAAAMAEPYGFALSSGWAVEQAGRSITRAYGTLGRVAPYVAVLSNFESPGGQLAAELDLVRGTVEADLLSQSPGCPPHEAARAVTPEQVARSVGSVLGQRLFAPEHEPGALQAPLLRGLATVYAKQRLGAKATADDLVRRKMPSKMVLKAAAPELLMALGFNADHPMVQSADQGGFVRGAGRLFMPGKLRALTQVPLLTRHVQALLPRRGEDLRRSFSEIQRFIGLLTVPAGRTR